jgi:hypothetical protein
MTITANLKIDFKIELCQSNFGNKIWESHSYQYMKSVVEIAHQLDNSVPKSKIMRLLKKTSLPLKERYLNVLDFLEETK